MIIGEEQSHFKDEIAAEQNALRIVRAEADALSRSAKAMHTLKKENKGDEVQNYNYTVKIIQERTTIL